MVTNTAELGLRDAAPIGDWKSSIISVIAVGAVHGEGCYLENAKPTQTRHPICQGGKIVVVVAEERSTTDSWALLKNGLWGRVFEGSHVTLTNISESVLDLGRLPDISVGPRFTCVTACVRVSSSHTPSVLGVGRCRMTRGANRLKTAVDGRKETVYLFR